MGKNNDNHVGVDLASSVVLSQKSLNMSGVHVSTMNKRNKYIGEVCSVTLQLIRINTSSILGVDA